MCKDTPFVELEYADLKRRAQDQIELKTSKCFVEYLKQGLRKVIRLESLRLRGNWPSGFLFTASLPNISMASRTPVVDVGASTTLASKQFLASQSHYSCHPLQLISIKILQDLKHGYLFWVSLEVVISHCSIWLHKVVCLIFAYKTRFCGCSCYYTIRKIYRT